MQAREVVGKARPRLGMLRTHQGLRVAQGCLSPQEGWRVTLLVPPSVGCASRCSCRPPPAFRLGRERRLGEPGRGAGDTGEGAGVRPGGAVQLPSLPPSLPTDPRVTSEAARRARAEAQNNPEAFNTLCPALPHPAAAPLPLSCHHLTERLTCRVTVGMHRYLSRIYSRAARWPFCIPPEWAGEGAAGAGTRGAGAAGAEGKGWGEAERGHDAR